MSETTLRGEHLAFDRTLRAHPRAVESRSRDHETADIGMNAFRYDDHELQTVYRVIAERRDMRHFTSDPVEPTMLQRLLAAAHHAPSVGYMQPWRFIRAMDPKLRQRIRGCVEDERQRTADELGERQDEFMRLKVEGIGECAELLVVCLTQGRDQYVFGRRTMPEMDLASAACAIQNLALLT